MTEPSDNVLSAGLAKAASPLHPDLMSEAVQTQPTEVQADQAISNDGDALSAQARRTCILVLGMHRSGTSAITRLISLLGAELPANMLGANEGNPTGHWEPLPLIHLHDRMLAEAGSNWYDWRPFDFSVLPADRQDAYRSEITAILNEEYGAAAAFVLKEPRISRFVPLYLDVLAAMNVDVRVILVSRNPLSVARSLQKRGDMSIPYAALLWLRHELDAERDTRNLKRIFLSYEDVMTDWRPSVELLVSHLQLDEAPTVDDLSSDIDAFLSRELQHHRSDIQALYQVAGVGSWLVETCEALKKLEGATNNAVDAFEALDRISGTFDWMLATVGPAFFEELDARGMILQREKFQAIARLTQRVSELEASQAVTLASLKALIGNVEAGSEPATHTKAKRASDRGA